MKKLISAFLAIAVMAVMVVPASALDVDETGSTGNTPVTATAKYPTTSVAYTVTIPTIVEVGEITRSENTDLAYKAFNVTLTDETDIFDREIIVKISGTFNLTSSGKTLPYKVYNASPTGGTNITTGVELCRFVKEDKSTPKTGRVEIDQKDIPAEGDYEGQVTFTISITDAPSASGS